MSDANADTSVVGKLDSFLRDVRYHSLMVNSASFNVRLLRDRRTRLPFFDTQTGIVQRAIKSNIASKYRMPGIRFGQIYAYPCRRWFRKKRTCFAEPSQGVQEPSNSDIIPPTIDPSVMPTTTEDSNTSADAKSEMYYYDEPPFLEDEDDEGDNEDDDTYSTRSSKRARRKTSKLKTTTRGRRRREPSNYKILDAEDDQIGKPYECSLCGARYKTRQGLSYHLSHTHSGRRTAKSTPVTEIPAVAPPPPQPQQIPYEHEPPSVYHSQQVQRSIPSKPVAAGTGSTTEYQDSYLGFLAANQQLSGFPTEGEDPKENKIGQTPEEPASRPTEISHNPSPSESKRKDKTPPTPNDYCDFCLGTADCNNKIGEAEAMVSCADCGRSGHLTCLQFSANMIVSVKQYPWQCLECKCCTLCGTSENDDKLLFCDDCDRGYHLYCLETPLAEPPEGEWSCKLCLQQFHSSG